MPHLKGILKVRHINEVAKMISKQELTPEEIRAIREGLGLSQVEAGQLIGGGPSAFGKYESGTTKPAAAVAKMLRLLEASPEAADTLLGSRNRPMANAGISPLEVSGEHISTLTSGAFHQLWRKLLVAEAHSYGLPLDGIHVASNITAPDGGEDGRIVWEGGPDRTPFLPHRYCSFQLKAGGISPRAAAADVLASDGTVAETVGSALEQGARYIMLSSRPYTQKEISGRTEKIRDAILGAGLSVDEEQVTFRDADQIATWVNQHPSVAIWVKEQTQPGTIGSFRSLRHWAGRAEHVGSPWVDDARLRSCRSDLRERVYKSRSVVRVVGLSGIGKSRLALEALKDTEEDVGYHSLSDLVLYAVQSEAGPEAIITAVQALADTGSRAIVVVDQCEIDTHRILAGIALRGDSRLSLVTIVDEVPPSPLDDDTIKIDPAPDSVIDGIIEATSYKLPSADRTRLARFSKGFPQIAISICQAWDRSIPIAFAADTDLVNAFVLGRGTLDKDNVLKSAALLSTFGLIRIDDTRSDHLSEIAAFGRGLDADSLYAGIQELISRDVAQRRGGLVALQPRPIAMNLAERQWREWRPETWERLLVEDAQPEYKVRAAQQLALLNTTDISRQVVEYLCRLGGSFDSQERFSQSSHVEVLSALAEIAPSVVLDQIERVLDGYGNLSEVEGGVRRCLVESLEKISFPSDTFSDGARILLQLAAAENEIWANNATGQFKGLFPVVLGGTEANGDTRLDFLDEVAETNDPTQRILIAEALVAGSQTNGFRLVQGPELQGSRPALHSWRPATTEDAHRYISGCVSRLAEFAKLDDPVGRVARAGLAQKLPGLVTSGFVDIVAMAVEEVISEHEYWPEALDSMERVVSYHSDRLDADTAARVRRLLADLAPKNLKSRVRFLVTDMPWDYRYVKDMDFSELEKLQDDEVRELAKELLDNPILLHSSLSQVSVGEQRKAYILGESIAEFAGEPLYWLEPIIQAVLDAPATERNFSLLYGYANILAGQDTDAVQALKLRAASSPDLAPTLPQLCRVTGVEANDIVLAIDAMQSGLLSPRQLKPLAFGKALDELPATDVAILIDSMMDYSDEAFAESLEIMFMYGFGASEKFNALRPQVVRLAEGAITIWRSHAGQPYDVQVNEYHFQQLMKWMLGKGRNDLDASRTAMALAKGLASIEDFGDEQFLKPLIPKLLSDFPEVAWPIIGQTIISDKRKRWHLESIIGDQHSVKDGAKAPILSLPVDTLFGWCHANPDAAPAFAAKVLPILGSQHDTDASPSLHPVMSRLINDFGERQDVQQALLSNIFAFGYVGSAIPHFERHQGVADALLQHGKPAVHRWARGLQRYLDKVIKDERNQEEEWEAQSEV